MLSRRCREPSRPERSPGDKRHVFTRANIDNVVVGTLADIVAILHRNDGRDPARPAKLVSILVGNADISDFPLLLEPNQFAQQILDRNTWIDGVQLVESDAIQLEALRLASQA